MTYELVCEGATSVPVIGTGTVVDACTAAGGSVAWHELASVLPELTLSDAGLIATAIAGLWAVGFCFRVLRKQLEQS